MGHSLALSADDSPKGNKMFEALSDSKPDAILALMTAFRADPRENKLDLGVGVYKDSAGETPVMQAVKLAETQLLESQKSKTYVSPTGNPTFMSGMIRQVFGPNADLQRLRGAQAPGGSGSLRIIADLLRSARPEAELWVSDPTWPNHLPLMGAAGFTINTYAYYDSAACRADVDAMLASLEAAKPGDIVLLHGCCHNPTGADLSLDDWQRVIDLCKRQSLFPFVDLAYQGFGDGLEQDAMATRLLADQVPEMAVAASCSKNFGLYRERVGAAILMGADESEATRAFGKLTTVIRSNYSMPPDHGAAVTDIILNDATLNANWQQELESMRQRMAGLRQQFADALRKRTNSDRFDYIAQQKGMFSRLPLSKEQIDNLRDEHGIYMVGDGRINVAGLPENDMDSLAGAIATALRYVGPASNHMQRVFGALSKRKFFRQV